MQYLYVLESDGYFKIGIANDVASRIAQLSTGNPHAIGLVTCYGFNNAEIVEKAIHQKLSGMRWRGEWFKLSPQNIQDVSRICEMLGGELNLGNSAISEADVEEAEEIQESTMSDGAKFDYAAMFADGWRMEKTTNGRNAGGECRYWSWRKGSNNIGKKFIYGGLISELPLSVEEMRRIYDGTDKKGK